jgi:hypothetical protein
MGKLEYKVAAQSHSHKTSRSAHRNIGTFRVRINLTKENEDEYDHD